MENSFHIENSRIRDERLRHLEVAAVMGAGRGFSPIYMIFAVSAVAIIYPGVSRAVASGWVGTYLIYAAIRTIATYIYHHDMDRENPLRVRDWRRIVFFSAFTHGVILGSLALIALPFLDPARQLALTAFVLIVTTGAVLYVSAVLPALLVLISTTLLPYVIVWHLKADFYEIPVSRFLFAAWLINLAMSLIHYKAGRRLFCLVADNEILVKTLEGKNRELEIADRARSQLLAVTSHDLRQPVHALGLILAHASEQEDAKSIGQHFEKLKEVSNLISEMLLELMDLSMLEHEKIEKKTEEICLTAILMQLKISQDPIARRKGLFLNICTDQEIWVLADAGLLRRMLQNLLSNAIKYTAVGGVEVECDVQVSHVFIKIRDTGMGIPSEKLNYIFQPYVRLNPEVSDKESLGLGLSIVQRAAVIQGFEVRVSSAIGKGSVFELCVPRVVGPRECFEDKIVLPDVAISEEVLIAVVDDDFFAREALIMLLEQWGYPTAGAESIGELKKSLVFEGKPNLIIADNHLGFFEFGYDAIQAVRDQFDDSFIPGIIVTGDTNVLIDESSHVEIAHKPINPTFLKEIVARTISSSFNSKIKTTQ